MPSKAWMDKQTPERRAFLLEQEATRKRERRRALPENVRARARYHKNLAYCKEKTKEYRDKNRERLIEYSRGYSNTISGRARKLVRLANHRAQKAGIPFSLGWEWAAEIVADGICQATGLPLVLSSGLSPWAPSIDRIDPSKGYIESNCRIVCYCFNTAKNVFSDDDVLTMARALIAKRSQ